MIIIISLTHIPPFFVALVAVMHQTFTVTEVGQTRAAPDESVL